MLMELVFTDYRELEMCLDPLVVIVSLSVPSAPPFASTLTGVCLPPRRLSQALAVSLHAAVTSPPSAPIPAVESSLL